MARRCQVGKRTQTIDKNTLANMLVNESVGIDRNARKIQKREIDEKYKRNTELQAP